MKQIKFGVRAPEMLNLFLKIQMKEILQDDMYTSMFYYAYYLLGGYFALLIFKLNHT